MVNKDERYKVYLHTIPKTITKYNYNKYYVGITCREKVEWRWGIDGVNYKSQPFYKAIKKYGWENIKHEVLYKNLSEEKAKRKEKELIKKYDSMLGHKGYNGTYGGDGCSNKNRKARSVYCRETGYAYRSLDIASNMTGESRGLIGSRCKNRVEIFRNKKGFHWFYCDELYIEEGKSSNVWGIPVIDLNSGVIYSSVSTAYIKSKIKFNKRNVIGMSEYLDIINGKPVKCTIMKLDVYLELFDHTETIVKFSSGLNYGM